MTTAKILIDGDWGGDEMQLAAVLLGNPDKAQILGAAAIHRRIVRDPPQQRDGLPCIVGGRAFQQAHADIVHHLTSQPRRAETAAQVLHQFLVMAHQRGHQRQRRTG